MVGFTERGRWRVDKESLRLRAGIRKGIQSGIGRFVHGIDWGSRRWICEARGWFDDWGSWFGIKIRLPSWFLHETNNNLLPFGSLNENSRCLTGGLLRRLFGAFLAACFLQTNEAWLWGDRSFHVLFLFPQLRSRLTQKIHGHKRIPRGRFR